MREDQTQPTHIIDNLITDWSNLQRKIDTKTAFYTDLYRTHEELKGELIFVFVCLNLIRSIISRIDSWRKYLARSTSGQTLLNDKFWCRCWRNFRRIRRKIFRLSTFLFGEEILFQSLETFVKSHSRHYYERILEITERLHVQKVSLPTTNSQINQFRMRWEQLHDEVRNRFLAFDFCFLRFVLGFEKDSTTQFSNLWLSTIGTWNHGHDWMDETYW